MWLYVGPESKSDNNLIISAVFTVTVLNRYIDIKITSYAYDKNESMIS